ncbi:DUF742 domain-containing protein [Streptomyces sp. NPDC051940]|uniref:DUF742 domain-containing protein n=1 Tax=Streptomyces sp. NPDC051940 TaxID=3155675 RepID=UPI003415742C
MSASARRRLVPAYLATGGRARPAATGLERLSVLHAASRHAPAHLGGEHRRLLHLLGPGALTVAETAAYLGLPVSATVFLAADLIEAGALQVREPAPRTAEPSDDRTLVERVLRGLRALQ